MRTPGRGRVSLGSELVVREFVRGGGRPGGGAGGKISARQSEEQMELLRQKQELENRLRLMAEDREKVLREADDRAKRYVDESLKNMPNAETLTAISENQAKIAEALVQVQERLSQIGSGDRTAATPTPTPLPMQGSNAVTASYNTVQAWTAAAKTEEEALKKQSEGEPAWDSRQGLQPGLMIPGILRTTLVSSTLLDRFQPCMQTTERIQVAPGFWLPAGTYFLGTAKADFDARRIVVDVNRLQYGNSVVPLKGVMLDGRKDLTDECRSRSEETWRLPRKRP